MGSCLTKIQIHRQEQYKTRSLWVATLNYSSILNSPFQYHSESKDDELGEMSKIFQSIACDYWLDYQSDPKQKNIDKWPIGKIDKILQDRYSPLYDSRCGIDKHGLLDNQKQFRAKWMQKYKKKLRQKSLLKKESNLQEVDKRIQEFFNKYEQKRHNEKLQIGKDVLIKTNSQFDFREEEIYYAIKFDFACFHAILSQIFSKQLKNIKSLEERDKIINQFTVQKGEEYKKIMDRYFNKSYIKKERKIEKTIEMLRQCNLDVLFMQEADQDFLKEVKKSLVDYKIAGAKNSTSVILINQKSFSQIAQIDFEAENKRFFNNQNEIKNKQDRDNYRIFSTEKLEQLNINGKTTFQIVGKFILISGHLKSKDNEEQIKHMKKILQQLLQIYQTFDVVCGFDMNSELTDRELSETDFKFFYPRGKEKEKTSVKMRTHLQPQISKGEVAEKKCKDYLLSTLEIRGPKVLSVEDVHSYITGVDKNKIIQLKDTNYFLPTDFHPYDHFMVVNNFLILKMILFVKAVSI